jgi:hypothetical protein
MITLAAAMFILAGLIFTVLGVLWVGLPLLVIGVVLGRVLSGGSHVGDRVLEGRR